MPEQTNQTKLLKCSKCREWKLCSEFSKDRRGKRGYQYKCKECQKQHYKNNTEHIKQQVKLNSEKNADKIKEYQEWYRKENAESIKQKNKEYYQENTEYFKQQKKEYYLANAEYFKQQGKEYRKENAESIKEYKNTPFKTDSKSNVLEEIKLYELYIVDSDNDVNFRCAYCGEYFKTSKTQIHGRLKAINGNGSDGSEMRLYCSQLCKDECPIYGQRLYTKDQTQGTGREVQPELRQMVLARDNYTCQKCNNHKDNLEVSIHCHHIWPTTEDPITSADMDTCTTVCADCHHSIHMNVPGCGYAEMRCSIENEMLV